MILAQVVSRWASLVLKVIKLWPPLWNEDCFFKLLFSPSVLSNSLWPHGLQHAMLPCPSPTPRACSNSCPLSQWCHPTISSSVIAFSSFLQSFPASGSFPKSQLFSSGGQSIGPSASTSVLLMDIQYWFPLGLTDWISLQSRRLSKSLFQCQVVNIFHLLGIIALQKSSKIFWCVFLEAKPGSWPKAVLLFLNCSSLVSASPPFPV